MFGTYIPPKGDAARQPLWAKARAYIVRRLSEGVWRPGEMLPSEKDLAAELGVSLGTVRRAVDSLEKSGIVNRVQGKGTFVRSFEHTYTNPTQRFFWDRTDAIVPFAMRTVLYETVPVTAAETPARILGLGYGEKLIHALRVYAWDGRDQGISELWLGAKRFARMTEENLSNHTGSLYSYYEQMLGVAIVSVKDRIKAKVFDAHLASLGNFCIGEPYLELTRVGYTYGGVPVEYRLSYCRSAEFHMEM